MNSRQSGTVSPAGWMTLNRWQRDGRQAGARAQPRRPRRYAAMSAVLISVAGTVAACSQSSSHPGPPFEPALKAHLAAIVSRDLDALLPTLTTRDDLTMIAPDGTKFDTKEEYVGFHRE
jgi:hypothetical protein